jgi:hypothetical protein
MVAPMSHGVRRAVALLAAAAAALTYATWTLALRGAPKVVDATMYWLQARALAAGSLTWRLPDATASFAGRFLLVADDGRTAGVFPPGHPLALAAGFALGAPWLTGCALAAGLVLATSALAAELAPQRADRARVTGAALSLLCVALRYHTAETLSHGSAALALTTALWAALVAARTGALGHALTSGLALGWLASTRPMSALAAGVACAVLGWQGRRPLTWALATLPGLALYVLAQRAATGRWGVSTHAAYYAVADGPAGCFRYGFGAGIGCAVEHGDFVARHLPRGHGVWEALAVTGRRLAAHVTDVANAWPLMALVGWAAVRLRGVAAARWCVGVTLGHMAAYAPFYFDGNLVGGGARMFVDVIPLEHALVAAAVSALGERHAAGLVAVVSVAGALRGAEVARVTRALPDRGVTAYRRAPPAWGLVFVDDERAFNTLYDPRGGDVGAGVVIARWKGDAHDAVLYERLRQPPAWRLRSDGGLEPWRPDPRALRWFRGAGLWPPRAQSGGYARPRGSAIEVVPTAGEARVRFTVPVPRAGGWCVRRLFADGARDERCDVAQRTMDVVVETRGRRALEGVWLFAP